MSAAYVPAVDYEGMGAWLDHNGVPTFHVPLDFEGRPGWRRLYVRVDPAAVDAGALLAEADTLTADADARVDELVALLNAEVADDLRDCHPPVNLANWDREASFALPRPGVTR